MNVALAHHWLTQYRGGEKVLEQIAALFPGAPIYTLVHRAGLDVLGLREHPVVPSVLNRIPGASSSYRHLLPLHPAAIRSLRVEDTADLLISSDAALMKGITVSDATTHVCYCHSPPRYLWELGSEYKKSSLAARLALDMFAPSLRRFDFQSAQRVDYFIANSRFVADRIERYYGRESELIYPPVATEDFLPSEDRDRFFLVISELVPYKRIDLAVDAFRMLDERLVVIGDGPERKRLESIAGGKTQFLGRQPFSVLKQHYEAAAAFVFPGIEDFGITPVEAQAAGCPVIAFRAGGALETVVEGSTGIFFDEQTPQSLAEVIRDFQFDSFDPHECAMNAASFSTQQFQWKLKEFLSFVVDHPSAAHLANTPSALAG